MTYVESGPHRVSWNDHEGEDSRSGERFSTYHIICDCIAGVEGNSPRNPSLTSWAVEPSSTLFRGGRLSSITSIVRVRSGRPSDTGTGDFEQSNAFHQFAVKTIASILELDARHPKEWPGNVINGEHRASVLSTLSSCTPRSSSGTADCWRKAA